MKYNKPEIVAMAEAVRGIQGQMQKTIMPADHQPGNPEGLVFTAVSAYEADE